MTKNSRRGVIPKREQPTQLIGGGTSATGPFDKGVAELKAKGLEVITAEQLAARRILYGIKTPYSQGTFVAENSVYGRSGSDREVLLTSAEHSPILNNPEQATSAHREGSEFYLEDKVWLALRERAETSPKAAAKTGVLLLPYGRHLWAAISVDELAEIPQTTFLFGSRAFEYGQWLKLQGIQTVKQMVGQVKESPYARTIWVTSVKLGSPINYYYAGNYCDEKPGLNSETAMVIGIPQDERQDRVDIK